jgi:hypothetical protein
MNNILKSCESSIEVPCSGWLLLVHLLIRRNNNSLARKSSIGLPPLFTSGLLHDNKTAEKRSHLRRRNQI